MGKRLILNAPIRHYKYNPQTDSEMGYQAILNAKKMSTLRDRVGTNRT